MSYAKGNYKRTQLELFFIILFIPFVFFLYIYVKYPHYYLKWGLIDSIRDLYFFNKDPKFWYSTLYTLIVCVIAGKVIVKGLSPYKKGKKNLLSQYQRNKFISIFLVQLIIFYLIPFVFSPLLNGQNLSYDPVSEPNREAYVYISTGMRSWGGIFYTFFLVPLSVYFFGKRYCSWFCACGNLAETIGVTKWGSNWVKYKTPSGNFAKKMEQLQTIFMCFGLAFGLLLFFDLLKVFSASTLINAAQYFQDTVIDFLFGALIGIGAYPFLGTRIWCRYGCPLAKMMELFGRYGKSVFQVKANERCKGLDLCSQVCPMGIDVASYAHKDKKPIEKSFSLKNTPCIGCGGCVDICPVDALSFP